MINLRSKNLLWKEIDREFLSITGRKGIEGGGVIAVFCPNRHARWGKGSAPSSGRCAPRIDRRLGERHSWSAADVSAKKKGWNRRQSSRSKLLLLLCFPVPMVGSTAKKIRNERLGCKSS